MNSQHIDFSSTNIKRNKISSWIKAQSTNDICRALQLLYARPEIAITAQQEALLCNAIARRYNMSLHAWFKSIYALRDQARYIHGSDSLQRAENILNMYMYKTTPLIRMGFYPPKIDQSYWRIVYHLPDGVREKYWEYGDKMINASRRYAKLLARYDEIAQHKEYSKHSAFAKYSKPSADMIYAHLQAEYAYTQIAQWGWEKRNYWRAGYRLAAQAVINECAIQCALDRVYDKAMYDAREAQYPTYEEIAKVMHDRLDVERARLAQDMQGMEGE